VQYMKNWFARLNLSITDLATTKWGTLILFFSALADAAVFPLPVTTFFIFLILLNNRMTFKYILIVVMGIMSGAFAGYSIGRFLWIKPDGEFTAVVQFLFHNIPGFSYEIYQKVHSLFIKWNIWILCAATTTPLPYGMFSIASGAFQINIFSFFIATFLSQGIKFIFLGILTSKMGPKIRKMLEFNLKPIVIISTACILILFAVSKFLSQF